MARNDWNARTYRERWFVEIQHAVLGNENRIAVPFADAACLHIFKKGNPGRFHSDKAMPRVLLVS